MQHWISKFRLAFRGVWLGCARQSSFAVHIPCGLSVMLLAWWLNCGLWQWCLLILCITLVLSLELLNSAIESMAKAVCREQNEHLERALDIAAGAVLTASLGAVIIGLLILGKQWFSAS